MRVLALDLGTTTGYAWGETRECVVSGTWALKPQRFEGGGMRYLRFREHLERAWKTCGFQRVVFEEVRRHNGTDAAHVYGGLLGTLTAWCEERGVPYSGVPVGTIKKFWTGKGNADKALMMKWAAERGYAPSDDNECDAIALLEMALTERA